MKNYKIETSIILKFVALQSSKDPIKLKWISNELAINAVKDAISKSPLFKSWLSEFAYLETKIEEMKDDER